MEELTKRHIHTLDFEKVLTLLKKQAATADGKQAAEALEPSYDFYEVKRLQSETLSAYKLIAKYSAPSFGGTVNVNGQLSRACSGGVLSAGELLNVARCPSGGIIIVPTIRL